MVLPQSDRGTELRFPDEAATVSRHGRWQQGLRHFVFMTRSSFNYGVFALEALNALGTTFYINYLFFFLKNEFAFTNKQNLLVCALNGLAFAPCALLGGRFGQKQGYLETLALGSVVMIGCLGASLFLSSATGVILAMVAWTLGMCFTWPNLEALASDHQDPARLPMTIGIYNVIWSGGGAIALFSGGAVAEALGWKSIFWVPILIHLVQIVVVFALKPAWKKICSAPVRVTGDLHETQPEGRLFLKMAWIANPFAYIAINTIIPLIPDVATRLKLSPKFAGFFCSIWFFSRMFTFALLALWPGWHYRFRHLVFAYAGMILCFCGILLFENLWWLIAAQVGIGWCIGLIYYSSLYYSMHVGENKGEHGGVHEAVIGLGIFAGPAIGAASLEFFPDQRESSVFGVAIILAIGLAVILQVRRNGRLKARRSVAS
jgi:MFS family permease